MQDGTNKVNTVKIKEIYDMSWPPNFDPYRELVLKIFSTRTTGPISTRLGTNHPCLFFSSVLDYNISYTNSCDLEQKSGILKMAILK
jgi:hypothetical protein